jgi:drug/metabolite transporter (DMT)-like permease
VRSIHLPTIVLLASALAWGLVWMPIKALNGAGLQGLALTLVAYGAATTVLLIPALLRVRRTGWPSGHAMLAVLLLGGWANFAFTIAITEGQVMRSTLLFYLQPIWAVVAARVFLGESASTRRWLAVGLGLLGAWLVLGGNALFTAPVAASDIWAVSAGLAYALSNVGVKAAADEDAITKTMATMLGCLAFSLVGCLWLDRWPEPAAFATCWAVARMDVARASLLLTMELVVALASGALVNGESLQGAALAGAVLIGCAVLLELSAGAGAQEGSPRPPPS